MQTKFYPSQRRGHTYVSWLNSFHSFSFGEFFDQELMNFGKLRVLNDDTIIAGSGFGMHPHRDMEIITIPLQGSLRHEDSSGGKGEITYGDIQMMSAGRGIWHSEYNASQTETGKFLQLWIEPLEYSIQPRYAELKYDTRQLQNNIITLVSPVKSPSTLLINQNAFISMGSCEAGESLVYQNKSQATGLYIFVISGVVETVGQKLEPRDALGVWQIDKPVELQTVESCFVLLVEVPME